MNYIYFRRKHLNINKANFNKSDLSMNNLIFKNFMKNKNFNRFQIFKNKIKFKIFLIDRFIGKLKKKLNLFNNNMLKKSLNKFENKNNFFKEDFKIFDVLQDKLFSKFTKTVLIKANKRVYAKIKKLKKNSSFKRAFKLNR
jgi:hypothetical protein